MYCPRCGYPAQDIEIHSCLACGQDLSQFKPLLQGELNTQTVGHARMRLKMAWMLGWVSLLTSQLPILGFGTSAWAIYLAYKAGRTLPEDRTRGALILAVVTLIITFINYLISFITFFIEIG